MKPHLTGATNGQYKHGLRSTPEYHAWAHMVQRCTNPKNNAWKNYGGRGISICEEWRKDPGAFILHIGRKPSADLTVERIDNNKGYQPGNVRWGTRSEQSLNRRPYKTHFLRPTCPKGHPYNEQNTWVMPNGVRRCRVCIAERARAYRKANPNTRSNLTKTKRGQPNA